MAMLVTFDGGNHFVFGGSAGCFDHVHTFFDVHLNIAYMIRKTIDGTRVLLTSKGLLIMFLLS